MKYYALLLFVLFMACRTARYSDIKLAGEYSIDDYQMNDSLDAGSSAGRSLVSSICRHKLPLKNNNGIIRLYHLNDDIASFAITSLIYR